MWNCNRARLSSFPFYFHHFSSVHYIPHGHISPTRPYNFELKCANFGFRSVIFGSALIVFRDLRSITVVLTSPTSSVSLCNSRSLQITPEVDLKYLAEHVICVTFIGGLIIYVARGLFQIKYLNMFEACSVITKFYLRGSQRPQPVFTTFQDLFVVS